MNHKFQRNYLISVSDLELGDVLTIRPPFTVDFSVSREFFGSPNSATIRIYNLNENSRSFLRKDEIDFGYFKGITFAAGYGDRLGILTRGNIQYGRSFREGVNFITELHVLDGGNSFMNSNFSGNFSKDTPMNVVIETLARSLEEHGVSVGAISKKFTNKIPRGNSYSGNATDILREITGDSFFIDNNVVNVLTDNEYIEGDTLVVDHNSGMIGKPKVEWNTVTFDLLLEPRLYIGQKIRIQIGSNDFDGDYVVRGITHNGTISEAVGNKAISSVIVTEAKYMEGLILR